MAWLNVMFRRIVWRREVIKNVLSILWYESDAGLELLQAVWSRVERESAWRVQALGNLSRVSRVGHRSGHGRRSCDSHWLDGGDEGGPLH